MKIPTAFAEIHQDIGRTSKAGQGGTRGTIRSISEAPDGIQGYSFESPSEAWIAIWHLKLHRTFLSKPNELLTMHGGSLDRK